MVRILVMDIGTLEQEQTEKELRENGYRLKNIIVTTCVQRQKNFKDAPVDHKASKGDLVIFDYKATVDGKDFQGSEGKNTQLELGKDLFIKGFDNKLLEVKKNETKDVNVILPENYPQKDLAKKSATILEYAWPM